MQRLRGYFSNHLFLVVLGSLIALSLLAVTLISPRVLPYNMDEFISYHQLACFGHHDTTQTSLETLEIEGCHKYDLHPVHTNLQLPLRSFGYVGSLPGLVYAPFFHAVHSPFSERLQGFVFLLAAVFLLARLLRVRLTSALLACVVFPIFVFSYLADTGPVGLPIDLLLGILLAIRSGLGSKGRRQTTFLLLAGVLSFLDFWIKPTFIWWLPVISTYILLRPMLRGTHFKQALSKSWKAYSLFLAGFLPLAILLLTTVDRQGSFYYQFLVLTSARVHSLHELLFNAHKLLPAIYNGNHISSVAVVLKFAFVDLVPVILLGLLLWRGVLRRPTDRRVVVLLGCAFLTFWVAAFFGGRLTHHAVLMSVFLVMALAVLLDRLPLKTIGVVAIVVAAYWVGLLHRLPSADVYANTNKPKELFLKQVDAIRDPTIAQIDTSWGVYYEAVLFSPPGQKVLYFNLDVSPLTTFGPKLKLLKKDGVHKIMVVTEQSDAANVYGYMNKAFGQPCAAYTNANWSALTYQLP